MATEAQGSKWLDGKTRTTAGHNGTKTDKRRRDGRKTLQSAVSSMSLANARAT